MQAIVLKYGLAPFIRLSTEVREARWDEKAQWPHNMAKFTEMTSSEDLDDYEIGRRQRRLRA